MKDDPRDLSSAAVTRRLEQVRALYKLMVALREVRIEPAASIKKP
jgi:site-specific recombinase XerC